MFNIYMLLACHSFAIPLRYSTGIFSMVCSAIYSPQYTSYRLLIRIDTLQERTHSIQTIPVYCIYYSTNSYWFDMSGQPATAARMHSSHISRRRKRIKLPTIPHSWICLQRRSSILQRRMCVRRSTQTPQMNSLHSLKLILKDGPGRIERDYVKK